MEHFLNTQAACLGLWMLVAIEWFGAFGAFALLFVFFVLSMLFSCPSALLGVVVFLRTLFRGLLQV